MNERYAARLTAARDWAQQASILALRYFGDRAAMATRAKGFQDVVTEADLAVEHFLRERIATAFPGDGVLGEEGGGADAEQLWVLDPIDGTANFARGKPHWCVSIGYAEAGRPVVGVLAAPVYGETWWAMAGGGAFRNDVPVRVSAIDDPKQATLEIGWTPRRINSDYLSLEQRALEAGMVVHRSGSASLAVAFVADGRIDGFSELHTNSWDVAAGDVIAREAGAYASDFFTAGAMTKGNEYLVCTPALTAILGDVTGIR